MLSSFKLTKETTLSDTIKLSIFTHDRMQNMIKDHLNELCYQYGVTSVKGVVVQKLIDELTRNPDLTRWNMLALMLSDILDLYSAIIKTDIEHLEKVKLNALVLQTTQCSAAALPGVIQSVTKTLMNWKKDVV